MPRRRRRRFTLSQAKNIVKRSLKEIIDPSPAQISDLWEYFDGRCAYCGRQLGSTGYHLDHIISCGGNDLGNRAISCGDCNDLKRELDYRDFLKGKDDCAKKVKKIEEWLASHPAKEIDPLVQKEFERIVEKACKSIDEWAKECRKSIPSK
jgi:hypothetical protein